MVNEDAVGKKIQNHELHCILSNIRKYHIADHHAMDISIVDASEKHFISRSSHAPGIPASSYNDGFI